MSIGSLDSLAAKILTAAVQGDHEVVAQPVVNGGYSVSAGHEGEEWWSSSPEEEAELRAAIVRLWSQGLIEPIPDSGGYFAVTEKGISTAGALS